MYLHFIVTYGMGIINVKAAYDWLIDQGHQPVDPTLEKDVEIFNVEKSSRYNYF